MKDTTDTIIAIMLITIVIALPFILIGTTVYSFYEKENTDEFCSNKRYDYSRTRDYVRGEEYIECCHEKPGEDVCTWVKYEDK